MADDANCNKDGDEEDDGASSDGGSSSNGSGGGQKMRGLLDNSDGRKNRLSFQGLNQKNHLKSIWIKNVVDTYPLMAQGLISGADIPKSTEDIMNPAKKPSEDMVTVRIKKSPSISGGMGRR